MSLSDVRGAASRSYIWPAALLTLAGLGWWWSAVSAGDMGGDGMSMDGMPMEPQPTMSFIAFLVAWVAMMAAMMFPAV